MNPLLQVCQDQTLPVQVQLVFAAIAGKDKAAALRRRFHQQVYLRIVPQGFEMSYTFHGAWIVS